MAPLGPTASKAPGASSNRAWDVLTPALSPWALDAVSSMGFSRMTPVQASTIPLFMGNKDVVVEAVTGSGKTLAFLIPAIEKLLRLSDPIKKHHIGAIIISPTRELATQIHTVLENILAFHPPSAAYLPRNKDDDEHTDSKPSFSSSALKVIPQLLLGGTTTPAQDLATFLSTSPNLLVATPGRLLELLSSPHVHCPQSSFELLIMDEADRLLDLGFSETLQRILARLPKQRRTGLFSASMSEALDQLVRVGLRNPVRIAVKVRSANGAQEKRTPASLQMTYMTTRPTQRWPAVCQLLTVLDPAPQKVLIYLSTCAAVDYWQHILSSILPSSFTVVPLHGKHPPNVRTKNFAKFVGMLTPGILLTTDVAARGLDVPNVDLVVQIDPPADPKTFIHRCGRAGRAGRKGLAVICLNQGKEQDYIEFLRIRGTPISPLSASEPNLASFKGEAEGESKEQACTDAIRRIVMTDRAIHDKAQRAFVSWVRSYSGHAASSIFDVKDIDWPSQAHAWGLLRLPKMPELKRHPDLDRKLGLAGHEEFDLDKLMYKDKTREKRRIDEAAEYAARIADPKSKPIRTSDHVTEDRRKEKSWSGKKAEKAEREARRERKKTRREQERLAGLDGPQMVEEMKLRDMIAVVQGQVAAKERADAGADEEEFCGFD